MYLIPDGQLYKISAHVSGWQPRVNETNNGKSHLKYDVTFLADIGSIPGHPGPIHGVPGLGLSSLTLPVPTRW